MKKNKYIFKYDQNGELYNYVELNRVNKIISFFKLEGKKLIRFDRNSDTKQLIKFKNSVRIKQKFMSGESFLSIFDAEKDECVQHSMPEKERSIILVKNNISISDFGKYVVERWRSITEKESHIFKEDNTLKPSSDISNRFPQSLRKAIRSIFSSQIEFVVENAGQK